MDELHGELAGPDHVARLAGSDGGLVQQLVLIQLELHQTGGHTGGVDRGVDVAHDIGHGADVVLVAMGQEDAADAILVLDEIGDVRNDHVNAVHVVVRETHAHSPQR